MSKLDGEKTYYSAIYWELIDWGETVLSILYDPCTNVFIFVDL